MFCLRENTCKKVGTSGGDALILMLASLTKVFKLITAPRVHSTQDALLLQQTICKRREDTLR